MKKKRMPPCNKECFLSPSQCIWPFLTSLNAILNPDVTPEPPLNAHFKTLYPRAKPTQQFIESERLSSTDTEADSFCVKKTNGIKACFAFVF